MYEAPGMFFMFLIHVSQSLFKLVQQKSKAIQLFQQSLVHRTFLVTFLCHSVMTRRNNWPSFSSAWRSYGNYKSSKQINVFIVTLLSIFVKLLYICGFEIEWKYMEKKKKKNWAESAQTVKRSISCLKKSISSSTWLCIPFSLPLLREKRIERRDNNGTRWSLSWDISIAQLKVGRLEFEF